MRELILKRQPTCSPVGLLPTIAIFCLFGGIGGCCPKCVVQPCENACPDGRQDTAAPGGNDQEAGPPREPTREPSRAKRPHIVSIVQSPTGEHETISFTINGRGFDSGAVLEVYGKSGKIVWSGPIRGGKQDANGRQVALSNSAKNIPPGKYTLKIKNPNGEYSEAKAFTIVEPPNPCLGNASKKPKAVFLGGGEAASLFERYLSQNPDIENNLPRDIKIKFYKKEGENADPVLQTVALGDMEVMFVESQEDFISKTKQKLKGKVAEYVASLADEAQRGLGDYFQCPPAPPKESDEVR